MTHLIEFRFNGKTSELLEVEDSQVEKIEVMRDMVEAITGNKCQIFVDGVLHFD